MKKSEILIIVFVVTVCIFRFFTKVRDDYFLSPFENKSVALEGIVIDEPDIRTSGVRVLLEVSKIYFEGKEKIDTKDSHLVLTSIKTSIDLKYGDKVSIRGVLQRPDIIEQDNGTEFDYPHYLGKDGIYFLFKGNSIDLLSSHQGNPMKEFLLDLKQRFIKKINDELPEPHSLLASGLIVAGKGVLGDDLNEQFRRVGLIHVVVLSGSNVTIVAEAITKLLSFLPTLIAATGGIMGIISFTIIAGTSATVVRSAIMSIICMIGMAFGKKSEALRSVIVAASLMSVMNPDIVVYDPSFQLSFAGTLGLILLNEKVMNWFRWLPERFGVREIISSSVTSQICLTPMLLHMSGMFSFVALIVNVMVLPLIPLTMLTVFLGGCVGFIVPNLAMLFATVSYGLLEYELRVVSLFSSWKFSAISVKPLSWLVVFGIYCSYTVIYFFWNIYKKSCHRSDRTLVKQLDLIGEKQREVLRDV